MKQSGYVGVPRSAGCARPLTQTWTCGSAGGAASVAAAFALFRRPTSLWTRQDAALAAAATGRNLPLPHGIGGLAADGSAAGRTPASHARRGRSARALVAMSGEVDETNDDEDSVDPEQAWRPPRCSVATKPCRIFWETPCPHMLTLAIRTEPGLTLNLTLTLTLTTGTWQWP